MADRRRRSHREEGPTQLYGFAEAVHDPGDENPRFRLSMQFDAIESRFVEEASFDASDEGYGLVRIMTTRKRLQTFGVEIPSEGDWVQFSLRKEMGNPRAWLAPARDGFAPGRAVNAVDIKSLSAAPDAVIVRRLQAMCTVPHPRRIEAAEVLERLNFAARRKLSIVALDVGQASCTAFTDRGRDIGYFDVGRPLAFNRRSFPRGFARAYPSEGFVLLSHWDFDHYALAINNPILRRLDWYAPEQPVGPYTAKFQRWLGDRLHFIEGNAVQIGGGLPRARLRRCTGYDRNSSGYVLRYEDNGEAVLLTGDADYQFIPSRAKDAATALTLPHHGGKGSVPPKPGRCQKPIAVASYGKPNCYKHPDPVQMKAHRDQGWALRHTAAHGTNPQIPRADRVLYPLSSGSRTTVSGKALAAV